ncbi:MULTISPECIES: glutathione synthase [unclassified Lentimicrobium]|uniref:glutathione synthase n=1 Tax=unclassified Lentimicrobium TaxID=2677434 RepID=UPI001555C402|nr:MULTISPECIES: glutathione synthase [unclassified Lentimicrobium]NPD43967.1 glutathione synthase [Lentimicrobium sp. S6]NPD84182.1 glutathione synthase [Lentimicrobium sp. L6]
MRICFLMYPWESMTKGDSTLRMIHECVKRGHTVATTTPERLGIRESVTMANCEVFKKDQKVSSSINSFRNNVEKYWKNLPLAGFDVVFMRANPPLDPILLNFLDSIKDDVFVMNAVRGLREANNKIYTAAYYDPEHDFIPVTHVSKDVAYLKQIIDESDQEQMIMKPLDGYGGRGVIIIEKSATNNIKSLLDFYVNHSSRDGKSQYVILQEYIPGAEKGDVRVFMLNGEPVGALKRIPSTGDIRSNISAGGSIAKHKLTKQELKLCRTIGEKLVRDGLFFAGLDLIGGKLIEVNVMSPGAITEFNRLNKTKLQVKIINFIEKVVQERKKAAERINK